MCVAQGMQSPSLNLTEKCATMAMGFRIFQSFIVLRRAQNNEWALYYLISGIRIFWFILASFGAFAKQNGIIKRTTSQKKKVVKNGLVHIDLSQYNIHV